MSNNYFQFKQFRIEQGSTAMKVSTDACILGAWAPILPEVKNVLDIGTGTGLLALMLAQRNADIIIDAIELEESAAQQAKFNIANSPWEDRLQLIHEDVCKHAFPTKYDMVISNPPFFNNSLLGDHDKRNAARHTLSLTHTDLFNAIKNNLTDNGYASVLLPVAEHEQWQLLLKQNNWSVVQQLLVSPRRNTLPTRVISICSKGALDKVTIQELTIREQGDIYTDEFTELLRPFYLKL